MIVWAVRNRNHNQTENNVSNVFALSVELSVDEYKKHRLPDICAKTKKDEISPVYTNAYHLPRIMICYLLFSSLHSPPHWLS